MTPLGTLITRRLAELGISRGELARRLGYANLGKGARRVEALLAGDLGRFTDQIARLPLALEVAPEIVLQAIEETRREATRLELEHRAAEQAKWRADFKPHAIILTERTIPTQITLCLFMGGPALRTIPLDPSRPRSTFIRQALHELAARLERWRGQIPFFGKPTAMIVNFSPDLAVRYSLEGEAAEILPGAFRLGDSYLLLKGRRISSAELAAIISR